MADTPAVYEVDFDPLEAAQFHIERDGQKVAATFSVLRKQLLTEEIVECSWAAHVARIKTKSATYDQGLGTPDLDEALWQLLCLDCHLRTKQPESNLAHSRWFFYESDSSGDYLSDVHRFFVMASDEMVDSDFCLFVDAPKGKRPSQLLIDAGFWRDVGKVVKREKDDDFHWHNWEQWRIGHMRAAYREFYENTRVGRAYALAPGNERLDDLHHWLDVEEEPKVSTRELSKQVSDLSTRLVSLQSFVKFAAVVAVVAWVIHHWFGGR
jgi:hypothetical protein